MPEEKINHPAHYNQLPHEVIEIVADRDFCSGNAVKYILRSSWKAREVEWRIAVLRILKEGKNDMA